MQKVIVSAISIWLCVGYAHAADTLRWDSHGLRSDTIVKSEIKYFHHEGNGSGQQWHPAIDYTDEPGHEVMMFNDSLGNYHVTEDGTTISYRLTGDTLVQYATENPLSKAYYRKPLLTMRYPIQYGDSLSAPFRGRGIYCGNHYYTENGMQTVKADAEGELILDDDTIRNVLRIYTLKSYSLAMDMNPAALDTARLKQVIEERYAWYARGNRYPVLETIISTSYANLRPLSTTRHAYCFLPHIQQEQYADSINEEIRNHETEQGQPLSAEMPDIIHYDLSVSGGQITMRYSLDAQARIVTILADSFGMVHKHGERNDEPGADHSLQINCAGLRPGQYIFYINVNGKVYSEKVTL